MNSTTCKKKPSSSGFIASAGKSRAAGVLSANGATSIVAWGNAPRIRYYTITKR